MDTNNHRSLQDEAEYCAYTSGTDARKLLEFNQQK
jgi:hypothetical protein